MCASVSERREQKEKNFASLLICKHVTCRHIHELILISLHFTKSKIRRAKYLKKIHSYSFGARRLCVCVDFLGKQRDSVWIKSPRACADAETARQSSLRMHVVHWMKKATVIRIIRLWAALNICPFVDINTSNIAHHCQFLTPTNVLDLIFDHRKVKKWYKFPFRISSVHWFIAQLI